MTVQLSSEMPVENQLVWVELLPTVHEDDVSITDGSDGLPKPCIYATKAEVEFDIKEMKEEWAQQALQGERDEDDEYEGYSSLAMFDGEIMHVLDEHTKSVIYSKNWTIGRI